MTLLSDWPWFDLVQTKSEPIICLVQIRSGPAYMWPICGSDLTWSPGSNCWSIELGKTATKLDLKVVWLKSRQEREQACYSCVSWNFKKWWKSTIKINVLSQRQCFWFWVRAYKVNYFLDTYFPISLNSLTCLAHYLCCSPFEIHKEGEVLYFSRSYHFKSRSEALWNQTSRQRERDPAGGPD